MATEKKYLSLDKLQKYDAKIKAYLEAKDTQVLADAKAYAEGLGSNYDVAGAAAGVQGKLDAEIARAKGAEEVNAASAKKAQDDVDALKLVVDTKAPQSELDALEALVGVLPEGTSAKDVVDYVNVKTAGIATDAALAELQGQVNGVQGKVATIEGDYLKGADKTELEGKIATAQAAGEGAMAHSEGVASDLAEAVEALEGADAGQVARIEALEGQITGLSGAMHFKGVKDALPENTTGYEQGDVIIVGNKEYVANGEAFVEFGDASVNAEAITALTGRVDGIEDRVEVLEGEMDDVQEELALKAVKADVEDAIAELEDADAGLAERLDAVEGKLGTGEGSVDAKIATAKGEAISEAAADATSKAGQALVDAKAYADAEDAKIETRVDALEAASATHALKTEVEAVSGRVTTVEGKVSTLETEMDAVEGRVGVNEQAIAGLNTEVGKKAAQTDLEAAVTRIAANEAEIASFVEISETEINAMFP
jgi:chaperonin cofactor prefoldin